jgi:hypothetical protein
MSLEESLKGGKRKADKLKADKLKGRCPRSAERDVKSV